MGPPRPRLLLPLAVALALLAVPALAQTADAGITGKFPFLTPDPSQLQDIKNGILIQWQLFRSNDQDAFYYFALFSTLIGSLAIIFMPKLHNTKTVVSWLLLVIITLFAPYGSKLLFYPTIAVQDPEYPTMQADLRCSDSKNYIACGFTPQLAAMHVGSTLEVIFRDMFRSQQFTGMVNGVLSNVKLTHTQSLNAGSSWAGDAHQFARQCPGVPILPTSLQSSRVPSGQSGTQSTPAASPATQPYTISSALQRIAGYYQGMAAEGVTPEFTTPPPAIIIDENRVKNISETTYANAMGQLCVAALGLTADDETCGFLGNKAYDGVKAVATLLAESARANKANPDPSSIKFYIRGTKDGDAADDARKTMAACGDYGSCQQYWGLAQWALGKAIKADPKMQSQQTSGQLTPQLLQKLSSLNNVTVPVREYTDPTKPIQTSAACSPERANALFNSMFDNGYKQQPSHNYTTNPYSQLADFKTFRELVANPQSTLPKTWTVKDVSASGCDKESHVGSGTNVVNSAWTSIGGDNFIHSAETCDAATSLVNVLNDTAFQQQLAQLDDAGKHRLLANSFVQWVDGSSATQSHDPAAGAGTYEMQPGVVGDVANINLSYLNDTSGGVIAKAIEWISGGVITIVSKFIGPISIAILHFTKILIDMTLVMILIITPLAFLLGIAMPHHANGLLIQSVLAVFILKLVPTAFLIIDTIGGLIYKSIGAIGGNDGSFKQAVFVFAIAGMYTNIVGLTMFLLFKIGDPQNVSKLAEIDGAAKKITDTGVQVAKAAATLAVAVATGGALAAMKYPSNKRASTAGETPPSDDPNASPTQPQAAVSDAANLDDDKSKGEAEEAERLAQEQAAKEGMAWDNALQQTLPMPGMGPVEGMGPLGGEGGPGDDDGTDPLGGSPNAPVDPNAPQSGPGGAGVQMRQPADRQKLRQAFRAANGRNPTAGEVDSMVSQYEGGLIDGDGNPVGAAAVVGMAGAGGIIADGKAVATGAAAGIAAEEASVAHAKADKTTSGRAAADQATSSRASPSAPVSPIEQARRQGMEDAERAKRVYVVNAKEMGENAARNLSAAEQKDKERPFERGQEPGFLRTVASGMYGGFMAMGGVNQMPFIGPILKEVSNEKYEAYARARMWKSQGFSNWKRQRENAQRLQYAEKEASTFGAGYKYEQIGIQGAYGGIAEAAKAAAAQAAAKVRDDQHATQMARADRGGRNLTATDFRGATLANAIQSLETSLQSAQIMGGKLDLNLVGGGSVRLGPNVLKELLASKATNASKDMVDDLMVSQLINNEKDIRNKTHGRLRGDGDATREYVRKSISDDYQYTAAMKMMQGKQNYSRTRGFAEEYMSNLAIERRLVQDYEVKLRKDNRLSSTDKLSNDLQKRLDAYKGVMPVQRIFVMDQVQGSNQFALSSARAKYVADEKQNLKGQVKRMESAARVAANFDAGKIVKELTEVARAAGVAESAIRNIADAVDSAATSTFSRAALSRHSIDSSKLQNLQDILEEAGINDQATMQRIVTDLINNSRKKP